MISRWPRSHATCNGVKPLSFPGFLSKVKFQTYSKIAKFPCLAPKWSKVTPALFAGFLFFENSSKIFKTSKFSVFVAKCSGVSPFFRVSVQGVESLGGHFACLCRGFEFYEVKKKKCYYFSKRKRKYFYTFYHFFSEKS